MQNNFTLVNTKDATHVHIGRSAFQFGRGVKDGDFWYMNKDTLFEWEKAYGDYECNASCYLIDLTDQTGRGYPTLEWFLGRGLKLEGGDWCIDSCGTPKKIDSNSIARIWQTASKASEIYVKSTHDNRHDLTAMARDEYYSKIGKPIKLSEHPLKNEVIYKIKSGAITFSAPTGENQWPDNSRIDAIGQNGNNGEHYPHESESPLSPNFEAESKLNASTALYAFAGWLTSLKEPITFSENHWATPAADMVAAFIVDNGLSNEKVDFDCMVTPNDSAISKPLSNGDAIEAKPVFTQEMHDRGELPPVGSDYLDGDNQLCTSIGYTSIDDVVGEMKELVSGIPYAAISVNKLNEISPIDTRTDEEKLRDAMSSVVNGCVNIESAIEWLIQSNKFTITLNEDS